MTEFKKMIYHFTKKEERNVMNVITNFRVYDLEETLISSGYAMIENMMNNTVLNKQAF